MSEKQTTEKATVMIEVDVPVEDWIDYLTKCTDIFGRDYIGYWARGVERRDDLGWLVWEDDEHRAHDEEPDRDAAISAWESGAALPIGWHRLDKAMAVKAFTEGVKRWGTRWFEDRGDANSYDYVLQMAMLGEERYG